MSESEKGLRAIDTDVLIKIFAAGNAPQFEVVRSLARESEQASETLYVCMVVLIDFVWMLRRFYRADRATVVDRLERLLASPNFRIERDGLVIQALDQYRHGRADFADYLIGAVARDAGCRDTVTFDRKLREAPGFTVLE